METLKEKVKNQVVSNAKYALIGGIILLVATPIIGYFIYMAGYIVWIVVIGFVLSFFLIYYGLRDLNPMKNKIYKALLENPEDIVDVTLVNNYKVGSYGGNVNDLLNYTVSIVHKKGDFVPFVFKKEEREAAIEFMKETRKTLNLPTNE